MFLNFMFYAFGKMSQLPSRHERNRANSFHKFDSSLKRGVLEKKT